MQFLQKYTVFDINQIPPQQNNNKTTLIKITMQGQDDSLYQIQRILRKKRKIINNKQIILYQIKWYGFNATRWIEQSQLNQSAKELKLKFQQKLQFKKKLQKLIADKTNRINEEKKQIIVIDCEEEVKKIVYIDISSDQEPKEMKKGKSQVKNQPKVIDRNQGKNAQESFLPQISHIYLQQIISSHQQTISARKKLPQWKQVICNKQLPSDKIQSSFLPQPQPYQPQSQSQPSYPQPPKPQPQPKPLNQPQPLTQIKQWLKQIKSSKHHEQQLQQSKQTEARKSKLLKQNLKHFKQIYEAIQSNLPQLTVLRTKISNNNKYLIFECKGKKYQCLYTILKKYRPLQVLQFYQKKKDIYSKKKVIFKT